MTPIILRRTRGPLPEMEMNSLEVIGTCGTDGSKKSAMTMGVNIIRTQDGKAKKIFVK